jgi:hypothetical protein
MSAIGNAPTAKFNWDAEVFQEKIREKIITTIDDYSPGVESFLKTGTEKSIEITADLIEGSIKDKIRCIPGATKSIERSKVAIVASTKEKAERSLKENFPLVKEKIKMVSIESANLSINSVDKSYSLISRKN